MKYFEHFLVSSSFFLISFIAGCGASENQNSNNYSLPEQNCIEYIIAMDDSLGTVRNHACEIVSLSKSIENYVKSMDKLDFQDCPQNFKEAFYRHKNAWTNMLILSDKYPDLRGEMHDIFDIIEAGEYAETFKPLLKNIWDTWGEVEEAMK